MFARVSRYEVDEKRMDEAVEAFREAATTIQALDGFHTGYLMTNEEAGTAITVTIWEDERALESSGTQAALARRRAINAVDGAIQTVEVYDVPFEFAHDTTAA